MSRVRFELRHRVTTSLWFIPVLCLLAGVVLAVFTIAIDRATDGGILPTALTGDPNAALAILSTAAASMVSLTALVLTITGVVVQLAMGQFSPRSVRPFLQDRPSQFAIGVFVGAFAHSMLAIREVRSFTQQGFVPSLTIAVSFVLILVSVVVLVAYVHHIGNSLKVDSIIRAVGQETREVVERLFPRRAGDEAAPTGDDIAADEAGFIFDVDHERLVEIARDADRRLEILHPVGSFVPRGATLVRVAGDGASVDPSEVMSTIAIGPERTMDVDAAYGFQTLVDIAQRSLTESFNDPTTAAQVVDRIHDCLRELAQRELGDGEHRDGQGDVRVTQPVLSWDDYVAISIDPLIEAASGSRQVLDRVRDALQDVRSVAPPDRRRAVDARLAALERPERRRSA